MDEKANSKNKNSIQKFHVIKEKRKLPKKEKITIKNGALIYPILLTHWPPI